LSLLAGGVAAATSTLWSPRLAFLGAEPGWFAAFLGGTALWTLFTLQDSVVIGLNATGRVPIENSLYQLAKIGLLAGLAGVLPFAGSFVSLEHAPHGRCRCRQRTHVRAAAWAPRRAPPRGLRRP
jgi:hypothetical protein